jgi:pilus assembly protein CpaF
VSAGANGAALKSSAVMPPVLRADAPPRAEIAVRPEPARAEPEGPPRVDTSDDVALAPSHAADLTAELEVEVPIDLGTELRLAAAVAPRVLDKQVVLPTAPTIEGVVLAPIAQLKRDLHRRLVDSLEFDALDTAGDARLLPARIREKAAELLRRESAALSATELEQIVDQVVAEVAGLGPIDSLLRDSSVTDILVTGVNDVFVERGGKLARADVSFRDDRHLLAVVERIACRAGRRVDASSPIVDGRLPDGSRVNVIVPPLALDGPVLSIRRFGSGVDIETLTANGTMTRRMATLLAAAVHGRLNILICGSTGSGKTTLLNALGTFIPANERIVTIEDTAELRLGQEHVVRLEIRPPTLDGRGEVEPRDLVRNALRMRPTRLIVGDLRGVEAADMLQAMHTGHEGALATLHGGSPRDALARLENMVLCGSANLPARTVREQIATTIDLVVHVARLSDGRRRVVSISEVAGMDGDVITTHEIFAFHRSGVLGGRVLGRFVATGIRPHFSERLEVAGVPLPGALFDASHADGEEALHSASDGNGAGHPAGHPGLPSLRDIGGADERQAREIRQLEAKVRALEVSLERERLATESARASAEELRAQVVASRLELDVLEDEVRAARYDADEQRELQAMLQHRSRSLAMAVMGFVEVLDDLLDAARDSIDPAVRDRALRLQEAASRLLALFGLSEITGVGSLVDENQHDVVHRVPSDAHASGVVVAVVQRGFAYHGQPVRRAQVLSAE